MKIQFFGAKQDGIQIRETIRRMVERGRLGNFSLNSSSLLFREEAALQIEVCFAHGIANNFNKKKTKYLVVAMISAISIRAAKFKLMRCIENEERTTTTTITITQTTQKLRINK